MRGLMRLAAGAAFAAAAALTAGAAPARAQQGTAAEAQALVDRATLTVQEMLTEGDPNILRDARASLRRSRAVVVCPRVFRVGFILGGQGGSCVLVARDGAGSWSSPAFYGLGSGSIGLQAGMQDMQVVMFVLSGRGLDAVLDHQFKVGADASVSLATIGGGISGATTANAGADIVAYARARGLFAGIALEGSRLAPGVEENAAYYGRPVTSRQVVVDMAAHNPGADPLRAMLMQHSGAEAAAAAVAR